MLHCGSPGEYRHRLDPWWFHSLTQMNLHCDLRGPLRTQRMHRIPWDTFSLALHLPDFLCNSFRLFSFAKRSRITGRTYPTSAQVFDGDRQLINFIDQWSHVDPRLIFKSGKQKFAADDGDLPGVPIYQHGRLHSCVDNAARRPCYRSSFRGTHCLHHSLRIARQLQR
jgi:hypothetical protein